MYIIKSIVPFDMLVDSDMGLIKYVQIAHKNNPLYYPGLINLIGPEHTEFLQSILLHRKFVNPLSAIIRAEKMLTCKPDDMLVNFFSSSEKDIYRLSTSTAIMDIVCKSLFVSESVQFDILCKNEAQKSELLRRFKRKYNTSRIPASIIVAKREDIDPNLYGSIYVKDVHDILEFNKKKMEGKNIIIGRYDFNKEYDTEKEQYLDLPLVEVIKSYASTNRIQFIDIYSMDIDNKSVG